MRQMQEIGFAAVALADEADGFVGEVISEVGAFRCFGESFDAPWGKIALFQLPQPQPPILTSNPCLLG